MGAYFVRQPNGLLARFSSIVDHFTHVNLTREQATALAMESYRDEAERAVERALRDELPHKVGIYGDGNARWTDARMTVEHIHGKAERVRVEKLVAAGKLAKP